MKDLGQFFGNLPGAGGNPLVGVVYLITLVTGAGLVKYSFFTVRRDERGVWFRLGNVVPHWFTDQPKILRPGRPGVRFPFVWKLVKIPVNIRTNRTEDIETTRIDPRWPGPQKWIIQCDVNWRVQASDFRLMRAALRAEDLQETVMAIVTNALRSSLYAAEVGSMETDAQVFAAVKMRCKAKLAGLGVSISSINIIKYAPVDAQILANAISSAPTAGTATDGHLAALSATKVLAAEVGD